MRVLITGASGFVGRYLSDRLSRNHEVVTTSRQHDGPLVKLEHRYVPSIDGGTDWSGLLDDIDVVIHLAARVHVMKETSTDPLTEFRRVNVEGTKLLAKMAVESGVKRLIFMSSIKVNGEETVGQPFSAADIPAPQDPYGQSKLEAELALRDVSDRTAMACLILRAPVVYGPGVKGNIRKLIRLIRTRIPIPLGAVNNKRTMLSLENLGTWMERALDEEAPVPLCPLLMGDPSPVSTANVIRFMSAGLRKKTLLFPVPVRWMTAGARIFNMEKIIKRLTDDLEIAPTFEAFPGIEESLVPTETSLRELGVNEAGILG